MERGVVFTDAVTPSLPFDLVPTGQLGILFVPGLWANSGLIVERCFVKRKVVPLESARTTTLIGVSVSVVPGLCGAGARGAVSVPAQSFRPPRRTTTSSFRDRFRSDSPSTW